MLKFACVGGCGGADLAVFESTRCSFAVDSDGDEGGLAATARDFMLNPALKKKT